MHWELWDTETGNLVGDYDGEAEALSVVREAVRQHGRAGVAALALGAEFDEDGGVDDDLPPVIRGSELADRALGSSTGQPFLTVPFGASIPSAARFYTWGWREEDR